MLGEYALILTKSLLSSVDCDTLWSGVREKSENGDFNWLLNWFFFGYGGEKWRWQEWFLLYTGQELEFWKLGRAENWAENGLS